MVRQNHSTMITGIVSVHQLLTASQNNGGPLGSVGGRRRHSSSRWMQQLSTATSTIMITVRPDRALELCTYSYVLRAHTP